VSKLGLRMRWHFPSRQEPSQLPFPVAVMRVLTSNTSDLCLEMYNVTQTFSPRGVAEVRRKWCRRPGQQSRRGQKINVLNIFFALKKF
jgi:hypothetical protein